MNEITTAEVCILLNDGVASKVEYDEIRERFEAVNSVKYGHSMPTWVPDYEYTHAVLLDTLEAVHPQPKKILELGAGTGRVTKLLADRFPDAEITAVDNSGNMLSAFATFPDSLAQRIDVVEGDFFSESLTLEAGGYDAVVSVFAVCHGRTLSHYQHLYNRIFNWLKSKGIFICFDHVAGATNQLTEIAFAEWAAMLSAHFDEAEIHEIITSTIKEDFPLSLNLHLEYLEASGFTSTDILWKKNIFGIYTATKPE